MAAAANVGGNGHRAGIFQGTDLVFVMAAGTGRGIMRTGGDGLAVNADLPFARFLLMARTAGFGLSREIDRRRGRIAGNDLVRVMAILTGGGVFVAGLEREAVDAGVETIGLTRMTDGAVHARQELVIVGMLRRHVSVATDAGIGAVGGDLELDDIHEKRCHLAGGIGLEQRVVAMAIQAITVFNPGIGKKGGEQEQAKQTGWFHPLISACL